MQKLIEKFAHNPKRMFLIDGAGAGLSAIFLALILPQLHEYVGLGKFLLGAFAVLPIVYFIFNMECYFAVKKKFRAYIRILAVFNSIYCILLLKMIIDHAGELGALGWIYFIAEILILLALITFEFKLARKLKG